MSDAQDFADNPYTFMEQKIVEVPGDISTTLKGQTIADFYITKGSNGLFELHTTVNSITQVTEPTVRAYWCPYVKDADGKVMAEDQALYLFTAKMDGCSFGVGMPNKDKDVWVCHSNRTKKGFERTPESSRTNINKVSAKQTEIQKKKLEAVLGKKKITYALHTKVTGNRATVLGVRTEAGWAFYYQSYLGNELKGLEPMAAWTD